MRIAWNRAPLFHTGIVILSTKSQALKVKGGTGSFDQVAKESNIPVTEKRVYREISDELRHNYGLGVQVRSAADRRASPMS